MYVESLLLSTLVIKKTKNYVLFNEYINKYVKDKLNIHTNTTWCLVSNIQSYKCNKCVMFKAYLHFGHYLNVVAFFL